MKSIRFFWSEFVANIRTKEVLVPVLGLLIIPLLYCGVYLVANWDPYSNVKHLPVAVVNEDRPVMYEGKEIAIGRELIEKLHDNDKVAFHFVSRQEGERGLSENKFYLMIRIPEQMSHNATTILDPHPQPMNLIYTENSSYNFISGQIADKVVQNIKAELSQKVTETYVEQMFNALDKVADGLYAASEGANQIEQGLGKLGEGIEKFRDELNAKVDSKTSQAGTLVERALEDNKEKLDKMIHKEIDAAIRNNKPKMMDKIHREIDAQSDKYYDIVHDSLHTKIDELIRSKSMPAKEKVHQQIDEQAEQYGEQIRENMHREIDQAYDANLNKVLGKISTELNDSLTEMEPAARAKMHTIIDNEYSKLDSTIRSSVHRYIDEKVDAIFDGAIQRGKDEINKIQEDLKILEEKLKPFEDQIPPNMKAPWDELKKKLMDVQTKVENRLNGDQLLALKEKVKQDLTELADRELNKVGSSLVKKLHEAADQKFSEVFPQIRALANRMVLMKANELAPQLRDKAHELADNMYQQKSKQLVDKLHTLVDEKWKQYEPKVVNGIHHKVNEELNRLAPEITKKLHSAADDKVNSLEPMARDMLHNLADMKLDEAGGHIQKIMFQKMSDMLNQVDKAKASINNGFAMLLDGQQRLMNGGAELRDKLREGAQKATQNPTDKTYEMISSPVGSDKLQNHDVTTYGVGMAPYFLSLGFFVGALMFSMVYPLKETSARPPSGMAWMVSKFGFMTVESMLQVIICGTVVLTVIKLPVTNLPMFFLVCLTTSLTFFALIQFFITTFGNVGRFIIIILLVLQLSSTAGTFPIELTPPFFQMLHPWLPMTYTIRAFRGVISLGDMSYVWMNVGFLSVYIALALTASSVSFQLFYRKLVKKEKTAVASNVVSG